MKVLKHAPSPDTGSLRWLQLGPPSPVGVLQRSLYLLSPQTRYFRGSSSLEGSLSPNTSMCK